MRAERPLADRVAAGEPRAVARAISLVESGGEPARALVTELFGRTGRALVVGVTGAPGTGKSTLVNRLVEQFRREGRSVAVIAVDPTSPFSGGAILADRVRMSGHEADAGVFIRSMATRGHLGGLAAATADAALVLDAAGFDVVVVETVGVGQDEVEIVSMADVSLVVLVPGTGDDLQAIKAGVMEIADIFVVNKADREGADEVERGVLASLGLRSAAPSGWTPPVVRTTALTGEGVGTLRHEIQRFREWASAQGPSRRRGQHAWQLRQLLGARLVERAEALLPSGEFDRLVDRVGARKMDPHSAVAEILSRVLR